MRNKSFKARNTIGKEAMQKSGKSVLYFRFHQQYEL